MVGVIATPSAITRQEQKIMNAIMALDESAPNQAILERPNLNSFYVEQQIIKAPAGQLLFIGRVVFELEEFSALPANSKPWLAAKDIPQGAVIPAYYSTN